MKLSAPASLSSSNLGRGIRASAQPNEPAALLFELIARPRSVRLASAGDLVLAARALPLAAGRRSALLKPKRALLGRVTKKLRLTLRVTATDAAGNRSVARKTVVVKPPARKR